MTRSIIYPERLSSFAAAVGRREDAFLMFPPDRDHEDVFGYSDLLKDHVSADATIVTSVLDPDRFAQWVTRHGAVAAVPRWVIVIPKSHRHFLGYAAMGIARYLKEVGADVRVVISRSDAAMRGYYLNNEPGFAACDIDVEVVDEDHEPLTPTRVISQAPVVSFPGSSGFDSIGIEAAGDVMVEVTATGVCDWIGLPCSISREAMASVASVLDWYMPTVIIDLGTEGYGSTAFLAMVSSWMDAWTVVVEDESLPTRTWETKLLSTRLARTANLLKSLRIVHGVPRSGDQDRYFGLSENAERVAIIVGQHYMAREAAAIVSDLKDVLLVPRRRGADMDTVVKMFDLSKKNTKRINLSFGEYAIQVRSEP